MKTQASQLCSLFTVASIMLSLSQTKAGDYGYAGRDEDGNVIIAVPDGNGGYVSHGGSGGHEPLIPIEGGYVGRDEDGGWSYRPR